MTLSEDARQRLDSHLDAVEQALTAAGNTREQRRAVVDDLEAQINEMLAARSVSPTLADVEAVLAQVDPPSAYESAGGVAASPPNPSGSVAASGPRYSGTAIWGLVCALVSMLLIPIRIPIASANGMDAYLSFGGIAMLLGILGMVLGLVAISQIRRSRGALCGMLVAIIDVLYLPVLLLLFA